MRCLAAVAEVDGRGWQSSMRPALETGMAATSLGERTIELARTLGQRTLLPRLLVWSALVYLARGTRDGGKRYRDEAWTLAGAAGMPTDRSTCTRWCRFTRDSRPTTSSCGLQEGARSGSRAAIADRPGYSSRRFTTSSHHRRGGDVAQDWDSRRTDRRAAASGGKTRSDSGSASGSHGRTPGDTLVVMALRTRITSAPWRCCGMPRADGAIPYVTTVRAAEDAREGAGEMGRSRWATRELRA